MVGVLTEDGSYSVLELLGDEVAIGDTLRWKGRAPLGGERIYNVTKAAEIDVYFQNHYVNKSHLRRQLLF